MNGLPRMRSCPRLPGGLLGMLALVAAIEQFAVCGDLDLVGSVAASWRYTGRVAARAARGCKVLCFGDSLVKFGVLPRVISHETGLKGYSLALYSGSAPSSYFLLRRVLEAGARPSAVIVDFAPGCLKDGPSSSARAYPWAELLDLGEGFELARAARDPELFARIALGWLLPSFRSRYEIRASVLAALRGGGTGQREVTRSILRNWKINAGAQANYIDPSFRDPAPPAIGAPVPGTWRCDPVNARYVRKFLDLAARHRVAVYWLLPPVSPHTQALAEHLGDEALYDRFARAMQARSSHLILVDGRHAGYAASVFKDAVHLDYRGAIALSTGLAEVLTRRPYPGPSTGPRQVALPSCNLRPTDAPVENLGESRRLVRAGDAAARR